MIRRFTGAYRVKRPDLAHLLQDVWSRIASTHVQVRWSYIPRAGNRVADFLAGAASGFLLLLDGIGMLIGHTKHTNPRNVDNPVEKE